MPTIATGLAVQNSGVTLLARVVGQAGIPITQASLASISYVVTDLGPYGNAPVPAAAVAAVIAACVFDSLQINDPRWPFDSAASPGRDGLFGYNFALVLPPIAGGNRQHVDVVFTPVTGQPFRASWEWTPQKVYG